MTRIYNFGYYPIMKNEASMCGSVDWQNLARANTHPLRISILEVFCIDGGRTLSPKDLSIELQAPLSTVNYHVTELARTGLLELRGERQVRGAIEHFYRPVARPVARPNGRAPQRFAQEDREPAPAGAG
jgi:hypothetical protein